MSFTREFFISALLARLLCGPAAFAAEFEVLDRLSVDGYTVLRGSADISGSNFSVGGSTLVVKTGNVGIGTAEPGAKLEVRGSAFINDASYSLAGIRLNTAFNGSNLAFSGTPDASGYYHANLIGGRDALAYSYGSYLAFTTEGKNTANSTDTSVERMRIDSLGNVGIGTTNLTEGLTVYKKNIFLSGANTAGALLFERGAGVTLAAAQGGIWYQYNGGLAGNNEAMVFNLGDSSQDYRFKIGGADKLVIKNTGNVGIGTTAPGYLLDINGNARIKGAGNYLYFDTIGGDAYNYITTANSYDLTLFAGRGSTSKISLTANSGLLFNTLSAERMRITETGNVGIGTTNPAAILDIGGSTAVKIPVGTTAERPSPAANGMLRVNTTTGRLEYYNGGWNSLGAMVASGGNTNTEAGGYRYHTFTSDGTFTVTVGGNVEYLVVGGGGGGGSASYQAGGGGGGGYLTGALSLTSGSYSVTVGAGGAAGANGSNSTFGPTLTAIGGGRGGWESGNPSSGGSGGGGSWGGNTPGSGNTGGAGTSGQGNKGGDITGGNVEPASPYAGAGGGGAGAAGASTYKTDSVGGVGGVGLQWLNGTYYAGGGGGCTRAGGGAAGGTGGGGTGRASNGTANTGGGGGAFGYSGGSGIVIIRYLN